MMQEAAIKELLEGLKSEEPESRRSAWLKAADAGPEALEPLARLMNSGGLEVSRAAENAMWRIVRDLGAPEVEHSIKRKLVTQLEALVTNRFPEAVRRQALWMFSEIAGATDAEAIAPLLKEPSLREDARCAIQRIPGEQSVQILWAELEEAPGDFKMNIVQSLRARGESVSGHPCQKLVPKT